VQRATYTLLTGCPCVSSALRFLLATMRRAEEMYNYTSYPTLILFRGDSGGTNAQTAKCKYKEGDNKPGAAIHPGTRKDCWEFYGALTAALSLASCPLPATPASTRTDGSDWRVGTPSVCVWVSWAPNNDDNQNKNKKQVGAERRKTSFFGCRPWRKA
jgi:hypothetical protein